LSVRIITRFLCEPSFSLLVRASTLNDYTRLQLHSDRCSKISGAYQSAAASPTRRSKTQCFLYSSRGHRRRESSNPQRRRQAMQRTSRQARSNCEENATCGGRLAICTNTESGCGDAERRQASHHQRKSSIIYCPHDLAPCRAWSKDHGETEAKEVINAREKNQKKWWWLDADVDEIRSLLDSGADVNWDVRGGWLLLHRMANCRDYPDIAQLLLDHGADPAAGRWGDGTGKTTLGTAAEFGRIRMVELFLERDAQEKVFQQSILAVPFTMLPEKIILRPYRYC
jgi:hypothetical protein